MRTSLVIPRAVALSLVSALAACGGSSSSGGGTLALVSTLPANGATEVPVESDVSATFGAALASASVTTGTFYVSPPVDGAIQVNGAVATFKHAAPFLPSTSYTATLVASIADNAGNTLQTNQSWSFTTASAPDTTPPAAVTDLAAGTPTATSVPLTWTAVGNDGEVGTATSYDLRYASGSGCPLTASNFAAATAIPTGAPQASGSAESATATGLTPSTSYCFAIVVGDAAGNLSPLSNVATATTAAAGGTDTTPPATVTDLAAGETTASSAQLTWTAPGDDGETGTVASYDLRFQAQPSGATDCSAFDYAQATPFALSAPFAAGGTTETRTVTGLAALTAYCFALTATDAAGNVSQVSNAAFATTLAAAPGAVGDLAVTTISGETVGLSWTAPAHADAAATYDLYYAAGACPSDASQFVAGATGHIGDLPVDAAGTAETYSVSALAPSTLYCFGLTTSDDGATSALSNLIGGTTGDDIPPATVSSIAVGAVTVNSVALSWTAPGDNGSSGTVASYDLRYQAQGAGATDCSAFDYGSATQFALAPPFQSGGSTESRVVGGLAAATSYCFAFTATDAAGNTSGISAAAFATTSPPSADTPPADVTDLSGAPNDETSISLTWTAPGQHDETGTVASYDVRYTQLAGSATDCSAFDYPTATHAIFTAVLVAAGQSQTITVSGLGVLTQYCFALTASDGSGDSSGVSNVVRVSTLDDLPPDTMTLLLTAGSVTDHDATFTAVAPNPHDVDPGAAAASYQLSYLAAADCAAGDLDFADDGTLVATGAPSAPGATDTFTATNLPSSSVLCFAIAATDAAGNQGLWSAPVEVDTTVDSIPPAAVTIQLASFNADGQDTAVIQFAMSGDDGQIGQAAEADGYISEDGSCPITAANLSAAQLVTSAIPPAAPGQLQLLAIPAVGADVLCYAATVSDAAGNTSAVSNSLVEVINGPIPPDTAAASDVTATSLTLSWNAGSGDGEDIDTATSYLAGYTAAADCSAFSFAGATSLTAPAPAPDGTAQSLSVTGLAAGTSYCFGIAGADAFGNVSAPALVAVTTLASTGSQIAAVRAAIAAATTAPTVASPVTFSLPIDGAIVSYVKSDAPGSVPDGNGFFLQNDSGGPALYVAIDPATFLGDATPAMAPGDVLSLTATAGAWLDCATCSASNSLYAVTAATGSRLSSGATVPAALPLATTDVVIPAATPNWPLDTVLVSGAVTVTGAFASAGTGYEEAVSTTGADPTATSITLRMPTTLITSTGVTPGCVVQLGGTPIWRYGSGTSLKTELSAWQASDLTITSCPAPNLTASTPADQSTGAQLEPTLSFTFDSPMNPASLTGSAAVAGGPCATGTVQLSDGTNCLAVPTLTANATDTVFTAASALSLAASTTYVLTLSSGVTAANGNALAAETITFTTAATQEDCTHMVISQLYGAGGNSNATYTNDFVELHNNGSTTANLTGCSVQYASASGSSWQVTALTDTAGGSLLIPPGGYFLVQESGGSTGIALPTADDAVPSASSINLSGSNGKVALVNGTTALSGTASSGPTIVDFVGYGTATTFAGSAAAPAEANTVSSLIRAGGGCTDSGNNGTDFSVNTFSGGIPPRNSATAAATCE